MQECYTELSNDNFEYTRKIESMGKGLLFIEIYRKTKSVGANNHLLFQDGRKPPLDVAVNPSSGEIEYVSFFLQDEKVLQDEVNVDIDINKHELDLMSCFSDGSSNYVAIDREFLAVTAENNIWIVSTKDTQDTFFEKRLTNDDCILFSSKGFYGVMLKNISEDEWAEIANSDCV